MRLTQFSWDILLAPNIEVIGPTLTPSLTQKAKRLRNGPAKGGIQKNQGRPEARFPQLSADSSITDPYTTHVCPSHRSFVRREMSFREVFTCHLPGQ